MEHTVPTGDCHECAAGDCWYCERSTGTRLAADGRELPVCCCGRVFITPEGWIEGAGS